MRMLVFGCDNLGMHLASSLAGEGHKVTVMDGDSDRLISLPDHPNIEPFLISESLTFDLRRAGVPRVDAFYAVSDDDAKNAMAAQLATHIFRVREVVCRIDDPARESFYKGLGINTRCPTLVIVDNLREPSESTLNREVAQE